MKKSIADDEMPILIPDTSFNQVLCPETTNRINTQDFIARGRADFVLPDYRLPFGYRLVSCPDEKQYRMVTSEAVPETVYAVRLDETQDLTSPERACIQVMVWRTRQPEHEHAVHGIARRFFRYFLQTYSVIVTDSAQTNAARVMWEGMIAWALRDSGHYVYIYNAAWQDRKLEHVRGWDEFCEHWAGFCWGAEPESHLNRRVVISTVELD
ncbi:hypothetical protein [Pantoea septica]|uniref:hypothetical protein n=1 Tax=Pantoea septica TaxID=472695 RepID=UPI00289E46E8|nr:hypothetical protein [Pantoea septica]